MNQPTKGAVLVTGASVGIGRAVALLLDRSGYRVFAGVRRTVDAEALRQAASGRMTPVALDITDPSQIAEAIATVESAIGPDEGLAALVNNAGVVVAGPLEFLPLDEIRRVLDINVVGQVAMIQAALPLLRKGAHGRIVQITSAARHFGMPFMGAYVASKAGMGAACDTLRRELRSEGIAVSEVLPGIVRTPMWEKYRAPADRLQASMPESARRQAEQFAKGRALSDNLLGRGSSPESIAKVVLRAVKARRPRTHYRAGMDARFALLVPHLMPAWILDWFVDRTLR